MPSKLIKNMLSKDAISQIFAADLTSLTQRAIQYENLSNNKLNFHLVIVTASIGGLVLAADIPEIKGYFLLIASMVMLILFITGWTTLLEQLDLNTNSTYMYRRMGRIRQWFIKEAPDLYPYMPFNSGDDKPGFYVEHAQWRRVDSILVILNAVLASMFFVLLWFFLCFQAFQLYFSMPSYPFFIALGIGVVVFIIVWWYEFDYGKKFMMAREKADKEGRYINFPSDKIRSKFEKRKK